MKESENRIISLPKISDVRGNLSIIEQLRHVPFEIRRVYWIYDVPGGLDRGGHAYKESEEFIVALSGSFDVELDDGEQKQTYQLNRSYKGLYVAKAMWRRMTNFSTNSLALVLASTDYDSNDYIMDYQDFQLWLKGQTMLTDNVNNTSAPVINNVQVPNAVSYARSVFDSSLYELNKMHDVEGNLTFIYQNIHVPFEINRVFYSYDIPGGEEPRAVSRWYSTMAPTNEPSPSTVPSGDSMCRLASGRRSRASLRAASVWCWPATFIRRMTISAIMTSFWNI